MATRKQKISKAEQKRLKALCAFEDSYRQQGYRCIVGVDEVGRGPLAGPVVAAACHIPEDVWIPGVNDSKKLDASLRATIYTQLISHASIHYAIGVATVEEIDELNIYWASRLAMRRAVESLNIVPEYLLVDGMGLKELSIPNIGIVQGDSLSYSIAAASIIAKEYRDKLMVELDQQWPGYGFAKHKGYTTRVHLESLERLGPCPCHRRSFEPVMRQLQKLQTA